MRLLNRSGVRSPSRRLRRVAKTVLESSAEWESLTDAELTERSLALRYDTQCGEPLKTLVTRAAGLVREAARRRLGMAHFEVQLLGGLAMVDGAIVEMETGEGKTLTATLPLYLHALSGEGVHLATANDYLASRDADIMRPVFELLGMTVGVITAQMPPATRRESYACDITYGTANEFGFDFLKDRLQTLDPIAKRSRLLDAGEHRFGAEFQDPLQRRLHTLILDEADSILIDDARTPLILSALPTADRAAKAAAFRWAAEFAPQFTETEDFERDPKTKAVRLTSDGRHRVRSVVKPPGLESVSQIDLYEHVERAIRVLLDHHRDRQYVVRDGEVVIVDESTGRFAEGRRWRDGIHQAVEAKEQLNLSFPTRHAAQITIQDLMLQYQHIGGMTGTASVSAGEFQSVYRLPVVQIPTNRPCQRQVLPDVVTRNDDEKWTAIVQEVSEMHERGRPVLIGTRSIAKSEELAKLLRTAGIEPEVLHAKQLDREAEIVSAAGGRGRVTVATNMAGRGTDIQLGPDVAELGGLHVIGTELHDSARIDRQLAGRCARQGDPGSFRQFMAITDEILVEAYRESAPQVVAELQSEKDLTRARRVLRDCQRRVESRHVGDRKRLLHAIRERGKLYERMGFDPFLDTPD
ncbi:preprotein translocase subunit SecA [Thalassoroseus pseudoceratinae]|uniref:preprotein translocase subunit SecA n=1 Tax=Thalassoroseus pseudoceratinae TaxID=2713176 RepID=UPI0014244B82|nr:helicase-related protein [Thalassoroseus pseudoceratinae]